MKASGIDHIAVAVKDLEESRRRWEALLGLPASEAEDLPERGVRTARFEPPGGGAVELVAPLGPDSPLAGFLEKRGEGLHHICFEVKDLESAAADLKARGFDLLGDRPQIGAQGARILFIHPRSCGGVLVELRESGPFRREAGRSGS